MAADGAQGTAPGEQPQKPVREDVQTVQAEHVPQQQQQRRQQPAAGQQAKPQSAAAEQAEQQPKRRRRRLGVNRALAASPEPEDDYGPQRRPRGWGSAWRGELFVMAAASARHQGEGVLWNLNMTLASTL
jgi:hypothetical protein